MLLLEWPTSFPNASTYFQNGITVGSSLLRFIRFSLEYNSNIENLNVIKIINKNVKFLRFISQERLFMELKKILELKNFFNIYNKNYFKKIINQVYKLKFFERLNSPLNLCFKYMKAIFVSYFYAT